MVERGEVALGVEGRRAAGAGRGDRLPVVVVDQVAAGEDAREVGAGRGLLDEDVAVLVEVDLAGQQLGAGVVTDRDEEAGRVELALLAGLGVDQGQAGELVVAVDRLHGGVPGELDLRVGEGALLHDLRRTQLAATVDHRDLGGEAGQEGGLLDGGVAATDHGDVLLAEEEAVAGGAPAHPVAGEPVLVGDAELAVARAHRQDHGAGPVLVAGAVHDELDVAGEVDRGDVVGDQLGAEALGLGAHVVHELGTHDPVAEAGEVLDLGGVHQRAARGDRSLEHQRGEVGARGVDGGGVARRSGADDDHVADVALVVGHGG